jgi:hypothetical protein
VVRGCSRPRNRTVPLIDATRSAGNEPEIVSTDLDGRETSYPLASLSLSAGVCAVHTDADAVQAARAAGYGI